MYPEARQDRLLIEEVLDEVVVYDQDRNRAHRLNRTAALVWRHCDGRTSVEELAALLRKALDLPAEERLVWVALDQLGKAHLLRDPVLRPAEQAGVSRREAIRRLGLGAAGALLVPVVTSISAPTPAMAQYQVTQGCCWKRAGSTVTCSAPVLQKDCPSGFTWVANARCGTSQCGG
jgi:hypothetical protein